MSRPTGAEAVKLLREWDNAYRDGDAKSEILSRFGTTHRGMRGWIEAIRQEDNMESVITRSTRRNAFLKETPNPTILSLKMQGTLAVLQDAQHPYHDRIVLDLIRKFLRQTQPDCVAFNGDWFDFYQLSRFDKNPDRLERLQTDIDIGVNTLRKFREDLPNARFIFLDGNHEERLRKFLWGKNPELISLRCLNLDELLGFAELEIDHVPKHQILEINGKFKVEHGDVVSRHSSWTAKAMFERRGGSGICGHSHRGGSYFKHDSDDYGWWENFCTCSLHPEYVKNPNWMHGFSLIHFIGDRFWVEQIPIIKNKFMYGGTIYE